jgi:hypothetical protein
MKLREAIEVRHYNTNDFVPPIEELIQVCGCENLTLVAPAH